MPVFKPIRLHWSVLFEFRKVLFLLWLSLSGWSVQAADVAIIYPKLPLPYSSIFDTVIAGVEEEMDRAVVKFPIDDETDLTFMPVELKQRSENSVDKVAILLGKKSFLAEEMVDAAGVPLILACVLEAPKYGKLQYPVLSLTPDPELLFLRLKALMPAVKRIVVVYDPAKNAWLIELAKAAAKRYKLRLDAFEAHDLQSAVSFYRAFFSQVDSTQDALWLLQDSTTVEESAVLPMVLRESWNKNTVIFSSNFSHVKRGVLFSLYPDNRAMGKSLGRLAMAILKSPKKIKNGMQPLRDVKGAINLRSLRRMHLEMPKNVIFETQYAK